VLPWHGVILYGNPFFVATKKLGRLAIAAGRPSHNGHKQLLTFYTIKFLSPMLSLGDSIISVVVPEGEDPALINLFICGILLLALTYILTYF
jgi:hypothetical protein